MQLNTHNFRFNFILAVALCWAAPSLWAHAVVTESSLKENPVKAQSPTRVSLQFNSGIEISLSNVMLVFEDDRKQEVEFQPGSRPGQIVVQIPPLAPGNYALNYKIFAADGHLTEDLIRFSVENPSP